MWILISGSYLKWTVQYGSCVLVILVLFVNWPEPDLSLRDEHFPVLKASISEDIHGQHFPQPVTNIEIDWEYIDDFEEYRVEIAADQNFEDLLGTFHGRQAPCFVPREFLEKKGVYYYRIQVREVDDGWSMFSRPEWFRIMETIEMKPVEPAIQICLVPDVNCRQDYTQRNDQTIKRQWYLVQLLAVSLGLIDSQSDLWIDVDAYQNIADLSHVKKLCNPLEYWELFLEESISCTGPAQAKIVSNETLATAGEEPNSEKINGYGTCNNNDL